MVSHVQQPKCTCSRRFSDCWWNTMMHPYKMVQEVLAIKHPWEYGAIAGEGARQMVKQLLCKKLCCGGTPQRCIWRCYGCGMANLACSGLNFQYWASLCLDMLYLSDYGGSNNWLLDVSISLEQSLSRPGVHSSSNLCFNERVAANYERYSRWSPRRYSVQSIHYWVYLCVHL